MLQKVPPYPVDVRRAGRAGSGSLNSQEWLHVTPLEIFYCDRQLLALDALDDCHDLGIAGGGNANLRAFFNNVTVGEFDFRTPPAARRFLDEDVVDLLERGGIAITRQDQLRGINLADLFELVAQRLADPYGLAANPDDEMADVLVLIDLAARKPVAAATPFLMAL